MNDLKKCNYCGAMLVADAEVCGMCGSPTAPPPPPTFTGSSSSGYETNTLDQPEASAAEDLAPDNSIYQTPEAVYSPEPTKTPSNRGVAVTVEIIAGIFGVMGIGWMIAGMLGVGIGLLIGYWIAIAVYAIILTLLSPFTYGLSFIGLCCLPIFPVISGMILNSKMK